MATEEKTCGNCRHWEPDASWRCRDDRYGFCTLITNQCELTLPAEAWACDDYDPALLTKSEFSCSLHEPKDEIAVYDKLK